LQYEGTTVFLWFVQLHRGFVVRKKQHNSGFLAW
jgi:hypothetical protein